MGQKGGLFFGHKKFIVWVRKSRRRTQVPRIFRIFVPNFAPNCAPNFLRSFRASFRGKLRPEKNHQKSPHFFNKKSPGKFEEKSTEVLWRELAQKSPRKHPQGCPRTFARSPCFQPFKDSRERSHERPTQVSREKSSSSLFQGLTF